MIITLTITQEDYSGANILSNNLNTIALFQLFYFYHQAALLLDMV